MEALKKAYLKSTELYEECLKGLDARQAIIQKILTQIASGEMPYGSLIDGRWVFDFQRYVNELNQVLVKEKNMQEVPPDSPDVFGGT